MHVNKIMKLSLLAEHANEGGAVQYDQILVRARGHWLAALLVWLLGEGRGVGGLRRIV